MISLAAANQVGRSFRLVGESVRWWLVTNPFEKYVNVKMGKNLPQSFGVKITNI